MLHEWYSFQAVDRPDGSTWLVNPLDGPCHPLDSSGIVGVLKLGCKPTSGWRWITRSGQNNLAGDLLGTPAQRVGADNL